MRAALLSLLLAAPCAAVGFAPPPEDTVGLHGATAIGGRATFYRPEDAEHGAWSPGALLHLHLAPAYALEGSIDFTHYEAQGTTVHSTPIQVSLLGYFSPGSSLAPYLLIGGGWYLVHADGPYANPRRRFGPHVGAGLELLLNPHWSIDGSYRFLWDQDIAWSKPQYLVGRDFSERGHMITLGLDYRF